MNLKIMHLIYKKIEPHVGKFPIVLCCLSFKMHSTYLLRLFNDPVAILFMNWCILSAMNNQWKTSVLLYSVALSIKMNILLYLPGLLLVLNWAGNYVYTLLALCFIIAFQLSIAIPFLITNSKGYFTMAFDFSRIFDQKESAYWQFFPNEIFISRVFHTSLLVLHVIFLLIFLFTKAATGKTLKEKMKSLNLPTSFAGLLRPDQGCSIDPHSNFLSSCSVRNVYYAFYRNYFCQGLPHPILHMVHVFSPFYPMLPVEVHMEILAFFTTRNCLQAVPSSSLHILHGISLAYSFHSDFIQISQ